VRQIDFPIECHIWANKVEAWCGTTQNAGCRTLAIFKGAGFEFAGEENPGVVFPKI